MPRRGSRPDADNEGFTTPYESSARHQRSRRSSRRDLNHGDTLRMEIRLRVLGPEQNSPERSSRQRPKCKTRIRPKPRYDSSSTAAKHKSILRRDDGRPTDRTQSQYDKNSVATRRDVEMAPSPSPALPRSTSEHLANVGQRSNVSGTCIGMALLQGQYVMVPTGGDGTATHHSFHYAQYGFTNGLYDVSNAPKTPSTDGTGMEVLLRDFSTAMDISDDVKSLQRE